VPGPSRFAYYEHLSAKQQATYRKSDSVERVDLPDAKALRWLVTALAEALEFGKRARVAAACTALTTALTKQLGVPAPRIHVREVRPRESGGELHGLYTFAADDKTAKIEVWMRTAAQEKVVSFRTFLRTFLHEIAHHLDVTVLALEDSFHTEGFFRRESSLMRQLAPRSLEKKKEEKAKAAAAKKGKPKKARQPFVQLDLFPGSGATPA
jgi:hypothetical protein